MRGWSRYDNGRQMARSWRLLKVWTFRYPGTKIVISGTSQYDGVWLRPIFLHKHPEIEYLWVNIDTGRTIQHFTEIPRDAVMRRVDK
jgi:hypothetical protein